jgi:tetratricopeptide (TPR) repeat protein
MAFVTFYHTRDFAAGLKAFKRAVTLDPGFARAHHWYATALHHVGDAAGALKQIDLAQRLNPQSQAILADKGLLLFQAGRTAEAITLLTQLERADPSFKSPHTYLTDIYLAIGNDADFLREARAKAALLKQAPQIEIVDAGARGMRAGGREGMLRAMLASQQALRGGTENGLYELAKTHALLGDREEALRLLATAEAKNEPEILGVRVDPAFLGLHGDPAYEKIAARIATPA